MLARFEADGLPTATVVRYISVNLLKEAAMFIWLENCFSQSMRLERLFITSKRSFLLLMMAAFVNAEEIDSKSWIRLEIGDLATIASNNLGTH